MSKKERRDFIKDVFLMGVAGYTIYNNPLVIKTALAQSSEQGFWQDVKRAYKPNSGLIDLESGYFSRSMTAVIQKNAEHMLEHNQQGAYYMRKKRDADHKAVKAKLAEFAGVSDEEIVITRNTTEALNTIILGLQLNPDDEVIMAQDIEYGSMLEAWHMRSHRFGTKLNFLDNTRYWEKTDDEIVNMFAEAITPNTKLIMVSHMVFLNGQVMPIRQICDMAHDRGVEVMVDGAHAFAHLKETIAELNCDYYGASLHKWLGAPVGTGIMYIKKQHIPKVWPLFGDVGFYRFSKVKFQERSFMIEKFEHIGQHPEYSKLGISHAIDMHRAIGSERKEGRLRYLKNYWVNQVKDLPKVKICTPTDGRRSCAIANFSIEGVDAFQCVDQLLSDYGIFTVGMGGPLGVRVSPNLWNDEQDLNRLVTAIKEIAG